MIIENLKLFYRAWKYKKLEDPAGIGYLLNAILPGDTVMDIGAHKGGYTFWMRKAVGTKGKVIAFEPQQSGAKLLRNLFRERNVHVVPYALSDKKGKQEFYISPQPVSVSYEASLENKYDNAEEKQVDTTTIDLYCHDNEIRPSFIKIDVEGHEKQVLEGGKETLSSVHPFLLVEVEERHIGKEKMEEIFSLLRSMGYQGYFFSNGKKLDIGGFDAAVHQSVAAMEKNRKLYCNNFVFEPRYD